MKYSTILQILTTPIMFALIGIMGCSVKETEGRKIVDFNIPQNPKLYDHEVMVLGSFHFNKDGDGSDIKGISETDILNETNQAVIEDLGEQIIEAFNPTIIAVELMPKYQKLIDSLYTAYLNNEWSLGKNEVYQVGFRIAKKLGLKKVYCVDNRPKQPESVVELDDWEMYADSINHRAIWQEYDHSNNRYNTYLDSTQSTMPLGKYLNMLNSQENIKRNKELWFTGLANLGHGDRYVGADLTGHWYQRNTRIFVNIRNLPQSRNAKILVIYGIGHKWILDEMFEASPEFALVQPNDLLKY